MEVVENTEVKVRGNVELDGRYQLPDFVDRKLVANDVIDFGMFAWDNQIYMARKVGGGDKDDLQQFRFVSVSNFTIHIRQHMRSDKRPTYLCEVQNIHGRHEVFDCPTDEMASNNSFQKLVLRFGNFHWTGTNADFQRLLGYLLERMGTGANLQVLGWQERRHGAGGFWAFSNALVDTNGTVYTLDEHGCAKVDGRDYYVPAGNVMHQDSELRYQTAKRLVLRDGGPDWRTWSQQVYKVHREHGMVGLVFTVSSLFSDHIFKVANGFPLFYLYGEASTGKGELVRCLQTLYGHAQESISLTGKANTDKGKMRMFAELNGVPLFLDEYRNSLPEEMFEMLKAIWDRRGYRRGTIESDFGTEQVPVRCPAFMAGNYYPNQDDALLTSLIVDEMTKNSFSVDEKREFNRLKDMMDDGYSRIIVELIRHRRTFEQQYQDAFRQTKQDLSDAIGLKVTADRMITNAAVLLSTYRVLQDAMPWPFTYNQLRERMVNLTLEQELKRDQGNDVARFWDCFTLAVKDGKLRPDQHFKMDGERLYLVWAEVHMEYTRQYVQLYRLGALNKSTMLDKLKKHPCYLEEKSSCRIGPRKTSCYVVNMNQVGMDLAGLLTINPMPDAAGVPEVASEAEAEMLFGKR